MTIILTATIEEYNLARKYLNDFFIIKTGVGASNVIKTLSSLTKNNEPTYFINVGFCGSNKIPVGTVTTVAKSYRLVDGTVEFEDYRNGYALTHVKGCDYDCYTSNSFVTKSTSERPVIYDMELNYIAAFPINLIGSVKIVSDNLNVCEYENTIDSTSKEVWKQVRTCVEMIMSIYK